MTDVVLKLNYYHSLVYCHLIFIQWAFGVCCWEVFSLGKAPYAGMEIQNIIKYIASGNRLSKTALCGAEM